MQYLVIGEAMSARTQRLTTTQDGSEKCET